MLKRTYLRLVEMQEEQARQHLEEVRSIYNEMRGYKHDFHHHLQALKGQLEAGQVDRAIAYLEQLDRGLQTVDTLLKTGNVTVDAILSAKLAQARAAGIAVTAEANLPPELSLTDLELSIVIGNLLDNAIEGTRQLQENERHIFFKFVLKKDNFFFMIQNSCQENAVIRKGNYFLSTKKEKGHGMGILSVKRAVEECKGDLCIDVQKRRFQVSVILPKQTVNIKEDETSGKNN